MLVDTLGLTSELVLVRNSIKESKASGGVGLGAVLLSIFVEDPTKEIWKLWQTCRDVSQFSWPCPLAWLQRDLT